LLVCGAAHADAIGGHLGRPDSDDPNATEKPVELVLTPFSFTRLAEQFGYGAGNRAPWFYQQVWVCDGNYPVATRRALVAVARALREAGQAASVAEVIEAFNLAVVL